MRFIRNLKQSLPRSISDEGDLIDSLETLYPFGQFVLYPGPSLKYAVAIVSDGFESWKSVDIKAILGV